MIERIRTKVLWAVIVLAVLVVLLAIIFSPWWLLAEIVLVPLVLLGIYDYFQPKHSILRNYPLAGRLRFLMEGMGPELHQYLVENDTDGRPFDRDTRSVIYQRAKNVADKKPFGTERDVYDSGYSWLTHSISPRPMVADPEADLRVIIGGPQCTQPYSASVLNISAMSFGALGEAAVRAMNQGAKAGGFAHDTGEGGLSKYHAEAGGDLIWQIGTGYFGCRDANGDFDPEAFQRNATLPQVKMIEIKVSQGAKPGHGGILPAAKVTAEIAEARLVPQGRTSSRRPTTRRSPRPWSCARSSPGCASSAAASRSASSCASEILASSAGSSRRCCRAASTPTSSSSTVARAARVRRRWSSPTPWALLSTKACWSSRTPWWVPGSGT